VPVAAVPAVLVFVIKPTCVADVIVASAEAAPVVDAVKPIENVSTAAFAGATDVRTPSPSDATATSATRLKFVFVDMFFLSLVRFRNFLSLARRSFDLLIPYPVAHTCNAAKIRKSI
jgi:hypothetical protein